MAIALAHLACHSRTSASVMAPPPSTADTRSSTVESGRTFVAKAAAAAAGLASAAELVSDLLPSLSKTSATRLVAALRPRATPAQETRESI